MKTTLNTSTYQFECPCGKKVQTQDPSLESCPECGRLWLIAWEYEIRKAKGKPA